MNLIEKNRVAAAADQKTGRSNSSYAKAAVAALVLTAGAAANAAVIDVSEVVTSIKDTDGPIGLIGAAVLLIVVAIKAFSWVRSAIK